MFLILHSQAMELFKIVLVISSLITVKLWGVSGIVCPAPPSPNVYGSFKFPNECPSSPFVSNVDLDFIDGEWYQQYATVNGSQAGCDGNCVTMWGSIESERSNFLEYCCSAQGKPVCSPNVGSASLGQQSKYPKGVLTYRIFGKEFASVIVDIVYDVYFITYKCLYQGERRTEIGEIWSRKRTMNAALKLQALNKLRSIFVDKNLLVPIAQPSTCPVVFRS